MFWQSPVTNAVSVMVYNERHLEGLLTLTSINAKDGKVEVLVYQTPTQDMTRGVIYDFPLDETA